MQPCFNDCMSCFNCTGNVCLHGNQDMQGDHCRPGISPVLFFQWRLYFFEVVGMHIKYTFSMTDYSGCTCIRGFVGLKTPSGLKYHTHACNNHKPKPVLRSHTSAFPVKPFGALSGVSAIGTAYSTATS